MEISILPIIMLCYMADSATFSDKFCSVVDRYSSPVTLTPLYSDGLFTKSRHSLFGEGRMEGGFQALP